MGFDYLNMSVFLIELNRYSICLYKLFNVTDFTLWVTAWAGMGAGKIWSSMSFAHIGTFEDIHCLIWSSMISVHSGCGIHCLIWTSAVSLLGSPKTCLLPVRTVTSCPLVLRLPLLSHSDQSQSSSFSSATLQSGKFWCSTCSNVHSSHFFSWVLSPLA